MRRILLFLAAAAFFLTATAGPAAAYASAGTSCVSAADATYRHSLDGAAGTVTITAVRPLCGGQTQAFSLASYTAPAASSPAGQFVYDTAQASISAHRRSRTLKVAVPACDTRVYAVLGTAVINETTSGTTPVGSTLLGSATGAGSRSTGSPAEYSRSGTACAATPEVTFTNGCDGTLTAALSNGANANTKAVFLSGGRLIRVSPGHTTKLTARQGATVSIRASSFTTYVGTWRNPATGCTAATTPAPAFAAAPAPAAVAPAATRTTTPTPSASTSSAPAETSAADFAVNPVAPATGSATAALAQTGMSTGSILAVALGLLMIGAGTIVLTRVVRSSRRPA